MGRADSIDHESSPPHLASDRMANLWRMLSFNVGPGAGPQAILLNHGLNQSSIVVRASCLQILVDFCIINVDRASQSKL